MIDYKLMSEAIDYYEEEGFKRIESPWLVSKSTSDITKPLGASSYIVKKDIETKEKVFVASGEQSFLYLINKGFLPPGKYQTVTPCLRNDEFDDTHTKYFMKLELINFSYYYEFNIQDVQDISYPALNFFKKQTLGLFDQPVQTEICSVNGGNPNMDINFRDVEIGSYGSRKCSFCNWVYGTGLAEPRFSRLLRS
jgi:elongation factor P--beta-lysine ligase